MGDFEFVDDTHQVLEMYFTENGQEFKGMEIAYTKKQSTIPIPHVRDHFPISTHPQFHPALCGTTLKPKAPALGFLRTFAALKNGSEPHEEYPEFLHYRSY